MIGFGMILGGHVPAGWRTHLSRKSGLLTIASITVSILTAYGLYYSGSDDFREALVIVHLVAGVLLPLSIVLHVWSGCRHRRSVGQAQPISFKPPARTD
jgi:hypothetical protein